jgi:hypothetical protein
VRAVQVMREPTGINLPGAGLTAFFFWHGV